jgi:hypothetical protein
VEIKRWAKIENRNFLKDRRNAHRQNKETGRGRSEKEKSKNLITRGESFKTVWAKQIGSIKYLIDKIAAIMKPLIPEANLYSTPPKNALVTPQKVEATADKNEKHPFMILPEKDDIEESSSKSAKFCMAHLCKSFLEKHSDQTEHIFDAQELLRDFKVKQRRLYDLMNIL